MVKKIIKKTSKLIKPVKSSSKLKKSTKSLADRLNLPGPKTYVVPASIWRRGAAFIVDMLIINWVLTLAFNNLYLKIIPEGMPLLEIGEYLMSNPDKFLIFKMITFSTGLLALLYFSVLEWKLGQTLGKMLFKINAVTEDNEHPKIFAVLVSNIPIFLLFILSFSFIIVQLFFMGLILFDVIYLMFSSKNQRLFEKFTHIVTVQNIVEAGY